MTCPACHRLNQAGALVCRSCGTVLAGGAPGLQFVTPDGARVDVTDGATLGRDPSNTVRITDPTVSRSHAVVGAGPTLSDLGSSSGTWVDDRPVGRAPVELGDGSRIRLGDAEVVVERPRAAALSGRTRVVLAGASAVGLPVAPGEARPRLKSGYALKRLAADEGPRRWVLQDLNSGTALSLDDLDAVVLDLVDGTRTVDDLVGAAQEALGPSGPGRLVSVLAELAERDLLAATGRPDADDPPPAGLLRRLLTPHVWAWPRAGAFVEALYRAGGWRLTTRHARMALGATAAAGFVAFLALILARYGTPFVVANKVGLGGIVFLVGRFTVAAAHETAHGLALAACGRRMRSAGLKIVLVFPYAYVDTSEAWLESSRRRIAISAAGPMSDFALGGIFSLVCLVSGPGAVRDVVFQLALAAYLGGLFNLNPFVERDGYHILVDLLGEPGLRGRAREQLDRRLRGAPVTPSPALQRYAAAGLVWSLVAAGMGAVLSLRYAAALAHELPAPMVVAMIAVVWAALLLPVILTVARPLRARHRELRA